LPILLSSAARHSDPTHHLSICDEWNATVKRNDSSQSQDAKTLTSRGEGILKKPGRPAKES